MTSRVKRDYCRLNRHPRWKAWTAYYDHGLMRTVCDFCGVHVSERVGSGRPDWVEERRIQIIRGQI